MQIKFLGTGSAFCKKNFQTCATLTRAMADGFVPGFMPRGQIIDTSEYFKETRG